MDNRVTSDAVAEGIGKFVFCAVLGFALFSALFQRWIITVPLLVMAFVVYGMIGVSTISDATTG